MFDDMIVAVPSARQAVARKTCLALLLAAFVLRALLPVGMGTSAVGANAGASAGVEFILCSTGTSRTIVVKFGQAPDAPVDSPVDSGVDICALACLGMAMAGAVPGMAIWQLAHLYLSAALPVPVSAPVSGDHIVLPPSHGPPAIR